MKRKAVAFLILIFESISLRLKVKIIYNSYNEIKREKKISTNKTCFHNKLMSVLCISVIVSVVGRKTGGRNIIFIIYLLYSMRVPLPSSNSINVFSIEW